MKKLVFYLIALMLISTSVFAMAAQPKTGTRDWYLKNGAMECQKRNGGYGPWGKAFPSEEMKREYATCLSAMINFGTYCFSDNATRISCDYGDPA